MAFFFFFPLLMLLMLSVLLLLLLMLVRRVKGSGGGGAGLARVELAAHGEELGAVAPGGEDVLYHNFRSALILEAESRDEIRVLLVVVLRFWRFEKLMLRSEQSLGVSALSFLCLCATVWRCRGKRRES